MKPQTKEKFGKQGRQAAEHLSEANAMSLSIASNTSYKQRNNHQPPAADFCTTESMYNKFANVTTPHCRFPASWRTFCTFAAAIASFKTSTLPDSMAFLSAFAACTDHSSQYAFNIRNWLATGFAWFLAVHQHSKGSPLPLA